MKVCKITVFEHQPLKVGTKDFTQKHLDSLSKWLERNQTTEDNSQYFSLIDHGVKFKSWVGILQVGNLYIEVLPKISNQDGSSKDVQDEWRNRLCKMISFTKTLDIRTTEQSSQNTKSQPLWEIFYRYYLSLVQDLIKSGLVKSYKHEIANRTSLKGKLIFQKQITKNVVHKEKFYTDASVYNRDTLVNQVLFKALRLISKYPSISFESKSLLENFEEITDKKPQQVDWNKIQQAKTARKTASYSDALTFAELIIKGTNPDFNSGLYDVVGIMFDMNKLFEKYVAQKLAAAFPGKISAQNGGYIWKNRRAIPDIIYKKSASENIIFDTKWKRISDEKDIASADIFQMYVYCKRFNAKKAFLVYPWHSDLPFGQTVQEDCIEDGILHLSDEKYKSPCDDTGLGIVFWKWN